MPLFQALRLYHRHKVIGWDHLPKTGGALVVANHSLATYDIILLMVAMYSEFGRLPRPLIDRLFFKVPYVRDLMTALGAVQGSHETAEALLSAGEIVTVAPGGMREALRPSSERYQILWEKRLGFVKLAMRTQVPIILAACPKADDLYDVFPSYVTAWAYKTYKIPLFFARGLGLTPVPRPIKLVHFLSEPFPVPEWSDDEAVCTERALDLHTRLVERMHELMSEAVRYRG